MTINSFQFSPQMLVMVTIVLYANCAAESVYSEQDVQQGTAAKVSNGIVNVEKCCNNSTEYGDVGATDSQPDNSICPDMVATFGFLISNDDIEETSIHKSLDLKAALAVSCFTSTDSSNEPNLPIESNLINAPIYENATSSELTTKHVMVYSTNHTTNKTVQINNAAVTIPPATYKIVTELIQRKIPVNFPAKRLKIETNIGINSPESHCATGYTGSMGAIAQNIKHVDYRICYNSKVMQRPLNYDFIAHRKLKPSAEFFTVLKGTRANIHRGHTDFDDEIKPCVSWSFRSYRDKLIDMMDKVLCRAVKAGYNTRLLDRLRLFNVWLGLDETNTQEYNICDLYYIATNKKNLASANTHFKNTLSKVLLPCHIKDIHVSADHVSKSAELRAKQLTRPSFVIKSNLTGSIGLIHVSSFLKKLLSQQNTSTEKFTALDFYTLVMEKVLHASDNGKYAFNHHIKNLLHFMPELLVYAEYRIYREKQNPPTIDLAKEASKFRDVLVAYAKCHDLDNIKQIRRLEYRVRVFRVLTCKFITNAIANPNKKIHLSELAMKLRYNGYKNGYNEKAANILFILAFTAKDAFISGFLERVYTFEKLALSYNDILEELAKECETNREYACILHMLVKYYNLIGLNSSRKLMIYSWQTKTLVITQNEKCTHVELLNRKSPLLILYDELMRDT